MYVDESGDSGLNTIQSRYFALSGVVLHELRWGSYLDQLIAFRRRIKRLYSLKLREEIHSARLITRPGPLVRLKPNERLAIIRNFADELASMPDLNVINVLVDKQGKPPDYDVFESAWTALMQRFEVIVSKRSFRGPLNSEERGLIFCDDTDNKRLTALLRKLRYFNPVPNQQDYARGYRNRALNYIIEDVNTRNSAESYYIQTADLVAFLLYQMHEPNAKMKKTGGYKYFERLEPILCKVESTDPHGIVYL